MKLKTKLAILFLGFGLLACEPVDQYGEPLDTECQSGVEFPTTVIIMKDSFEVERAYTQYLKDRGERADIEHTRLGFCVLRSDNTRTCYLPALRGKRDDKQIFLWGHEFVHVVCGSWHDSNFTVEK